MSRRQLRIGLVLALTVGALGLLPVTTAQAAVSLTVSTTSDIASNAGDCGSSSTSVPFPLSLREATCIANNYGNTQAVTINVPVGTYTLSSGELKLNKTSGSNVTLTGAGAASTVIDGNHLSRVLDLDPNLVGGVTTSISNVTITNGRDGTFGGAGVIAGSGNSTNLDTLTVSNSVISNNQANFAVQNVSNKPGGGIQFEGGKLTLTNDTFASNQSYSSGGSGVWYLASGSAAGQTLTVSGSTFSGNSAPNSGASGTDGGALAVSAGAGGGTYTVTDSTFTGNTASSSGNEAAAGAAIFEITGNLTVTGSTFTNNSVSNSVSSTGGGAVLWEGGSATLQYDRMVGNTVTGTGADVMTNSGSGSVTATEDWWGCNAGPNTTGCDTTTGTNLTVAPRLVVTATASPNHVVGPNGTATLTASLLTDSNGGAVSASNLTGAFDGLPVSFADPPGDATVTLTSGAHTANLSSGTASIDYHSNTTIGPDNDTATLDNGTATDTLEVDEAPSINSGNTADFTTGTSGSFTITTTGYPNAAISETGSLPNGLTFQDNNDGSATISGTPAADAGGDYPLDLTASNGVSPDATQTLTLDVSQPPGFTSASSATFVIGTPGSFDVTTTGFPASSIDESGALPDGLTYADNGDGSATISGTPTGTGATYPVTLTASNGVNPDATQDLTIQVNEAPAITQNPTDQTVGPGDSVSFTAAASGVPTPTVQWQRSTDGGATFSDISGATSTTYTFNAAAGDNGNQYQAVFTNGVGSAATTTAATLTVGTAPSFTSADNTTFTVGQAGLFDVSTTGVPSAALTESGVHFPAWLTLTDNGDGTGALTGTPPTGSGGFYEFTLSASNGISPDAAQSFTLFVDESPAFVSADHTDFQAGSPGSFTVTASGYPAPSLTADSDLPSWATLTDNGDGTATLAGTPPADAGGLHTFTITADNAIAPSADQSFGLTVDGVRPTITSVSPSFGPAAGGTTITIDGTGFAASSTVLIGQGDGPNAGALSATVLTQTPTEITAMTPAGDPGTFNVFVHTPHAGTSAGNSSDRFRYQLPRPTVSSVTPSSGPAAGGTTITIDGTGFTAGSTVLIGQGTGSHTGAVSATVLTQTATEITAVTPAGNPGSFNVFVYTPHAGTSAGNSNDRFRYRP